MVKMKKWFKYNEQPILLTIMIVYLISFMFMFSEYGEQYTWLGYVWLFQFFTLPFCLVSYGNKKGWKWPERY